MSIRGNSPCQSGVFVCVNHGISPCQSATLVRVRFGGTYDCVVTHAVSFAFYSFKNIKTTLTKRFLF